MSRYKILCIDDEERQRDLLSYILKDRYDVSTAADGKTGMEIFDTKGPFAAVLLDMRLPDCTGLDLLARILRTHPAPPVVMITALAEPKPAVQAMKLGAADYLTKPFDVNEIRLVVQRIIRERSRQATTPAGTTPPDKSQEMIGSSESIERVFFLVDRIKDADVTVLITGETGTGKELVAHALHFQSCRKNGPFVPVHCAAIPNELLESELFGHEKGAFTGAVQQRIGMFEAAHGGTLFLDEIGEMPIGTQSKLLRAIQEREIRRVGSQETIHINVRLVCATNRDLEAEVKKGAFREDLFYRINVVPVRLPSLRERPEDIPTLVQYFAQRFATSLNRPVPSFTPAAMKRLVGYPWPGNVRELEHAVERLLVICDAGTIDLEHLPTLIVTAEPYTPTATSTPAPQDESYQVANFRAEELDLPKLTANLERHAIEEALRRSNGVITEAARLLCVTRRILRYKMDQLGITSDMPQS
jgi:DNA-binding NtrC family response regulator